MKTLQEDIDDLDRMIDTGAAKDAIRSQIRLIAREVAALEANNMSLLEAHATLQQTHSALRDEHTKFKRAQARKDAQAWDETVRKANEIYDDP